MDVHTVNTNSNTDIFLPVGCAFSYPATASTGPVMLQFFGIKILDVRLLL